MLLWLTKTKICCDFNMFPQLRFSKVDKLALEPDVGDIGDPELINGRSMHAPGQVQINLQRVLGVGGGHEPPGLHL